MRKFVLSFLVCCGMLALPQSANAALLTVDDGANNSRAVASNRPEFGNVWPSLAQSFIAPASDISFGFRLFDSGLGLATDRVTYTVWQGDGVFAQTLGSLEVSLPTQTLPDGDGRFADYGFVFADFSDLGLSAGTAYTVEVSTPQLTLLDGEESAVAAWNSLDDPYADGRFYFTPSAPVSANNAFFAPHEMIFQVIGNDDGSIVPVPALAGAFMIGLALLYSRHGAKASRRT